VELGNLFGIINFSFITVKINKSSIGANAILPLSSR
jgi:hypothetical protein